MVNVGHNGTRQRLDEDLHATTQTQTQVQGAFLLDVVTRHRAAIPELLAFETQTPLVWRDALIIVDLRFHVADGAGRLHVGHATPVNVLTKICVQSREPFYVLLGTDRSHMAYGCNNHGRVARQGPSPRGQNESTPERGALSQMMWMEWNLMKVSRLRSGRLSKQKHTHSLQHGPLSARGELQSHPLAGQAQACGRPTQVDGPGGPMAPVVATG